ncbi:MAG: hypothetical protein EXS15_02135 [Phycisphaerales bacterium]|nr:hypothetical protein [Phycisphaerales bacterium]
MMCHRGNIVVSLLALTIAAASRGQVLAPPVNPLSPVTAPNGVSPPPSDEPDTVPPALVPSRPVRPLLVETSDEGITATLRAPVDIMEVGKSVRFTLTVNAKTGISVSAQALPSTLGAFSIADVGGSPTVPSKHETAPSGKSHVINFDALTFESGVVELAAIDIQWRDASGVDHTLAVGPTSIEVVSLIGAEFDPTHFRDIKGAVEIDTGWSWWWLVGSCAAALLALVLWMLLRRRTARQARELLPDEWARLELDRLERDALVQRGDIHGFWVRLSGILREYVEQRFFIAAPDQTTQEFLLHARSTAGLEEQHQRLLARFLGAADMVKFAAHRPAKDECARALHAARAFVEETTPDPEQVSSHAHAEATVPS